MELHTLGQYVLLIMIIVFCSLIILFIRAYLIYKQFYKLSENNQKSIQDINIFIYQCFCKKINIFDKFRLIMAKQMMKFMERYKLSGHKKLAYILMRLIF